MAERIRFNKQTIAQLAAPEKPKGKRGGTYSTYHDTELRGLVCLVSSEGTRTFYLYQKVKGRPLRTKLGQFPSLSVEEARKQALQLKSKIANGWQPEPEPQKLTVEQLFEQYLERHGKVNKRTWQRDEIDFRQCLKSLAKRDAASLTKQEVALLHDRLRIQKGKSQANLAIALLRSVFNRCMEWGLVESNPAMGIKLYKLQSRDRFLQPEELARFYEALQAVKSPLSRAYFELLLLTGARRTNLLHMRKRDIDLGMGFWRIPLTKNGQSQMVPLVPRAVELLRGLIDHTPSSDWIFATEATESGHMENVNKTWRRLMLASSLQNFRLHDLRRTFATYQVMQGASPFVIGQSLGHKSLASTAIYARTPYESIRESVGKAAELMERYRQPEKNPSIAP
jgi:integrase